MKRKMRSTVGADSRPWTPRLSASRGSWAVRLADAIAADVASGRLRRGHQLPTQRALATELGITPGTVNRAYAIAGRAGLVTAEVGRGTFVSTLPEAGIHDDGLAREAEGAIDFALNYPPGVEAERALAAGLSRLMRRRTDGLLSLAPYGGSAAHRAAGARWLSRFGLSAGAEDVLVCTSVQHGLAATLGALVVPGDVVLTEELTSPGIKALAAACHLRLVGVAGDGEGLRPDALADACRATGARLVYTMPTLHTPTTLTMSSERRTAIARVLEDQQLLAIEDDAWGFLATGAVVPLRTLAPTRVVYLTSFSKSIAPGLRVGYAVPPSAHRRAIAACLGATTWTAPLLVEIACQWIDDGTASSIVDRRVRTARERQALAAARLGQSGASGPWPAYHLWLPLPEPWRADEFVAQASALGVALARTDSFVPGRAQTPHAVRVCTGTEPDLARVEAGLGVLTRLLASGPIHSLPVT